jgi:hypothetical protein
MERCGPTAPLLDEHETAARLRAGTIDTWEAKAWTKDVSVGPFRGGRVPPLCRTVPAPGAQVAVGVEGERTEAAAPNPYGTAAVQSDASFTQVETESGWFAV